MRPTWRWPGAALGLLALLAAGAGCRAPRPDGPRGSGALPAVLWSIQLEGDPCPVGVEGGSVLVWSQRKTEKGFRYGIRLEGYATADGRAVFSVPIRPWLSHVAAPWSFHLAARDALISVWEKGNVVRTIGSETGEDRWSYPNALGVVAAGPYRWVASERSLFALRPSTSRVERVTRLPGTAATPPVLAGGHVVVTTTAGDLVGVEATSGQVAWTARMTRAGARRPVAAGDDVVVTYATEQGPDAGVRLEVRRGRDGWVRFHVDLPRAEAALLLAVEEGVQAAGDLLLVREPAAGCLRALELATGRQRFRQCGVLGSSLPVLAGAVAYYLADDPVARAREQQGVPWTVVDRPVWALDLATGQAQPLRLPVDRRSGGAAVRAVRLPLRPVTDGVLHLLQGHLFLTALRVAPERTAGPTSRSVGSSP